MKKKRIYAYNLSTPLPRPKTYVGRIFYNLYLLGLTPGATFLYGSWNLGKSSFWLYVDGLTLDTSNRFTLKVIIAIIKTLTYNEVITTSNVLWSYFDCIVGMVEDGAINACTINSNKQLYKHKLFFFQCILEWEIVVSYNCLNIYWITVLFGWDLRIRGLFGGFFSCLLLFHFEFGFLCEASVLLISHISVVIEVHVS